MNTNLSIAFFGTPDRAVIALDTLKELGILPKLVVTQPDRPQGRKFVLTPPEVKVWAENEKISVVQPDKLSEESFIKTLEGGKFDIFIVVAYGKIIPENILSIPKYGCINLHGSLLPELRGASPIETAILQDKRDTGVTIIKMDKLLDHGPIIASQKVNLPNWPIKTEELAHKIITYGAKLIAQNMEAWTNGKVVAIEQDHSKATFAKKIVKEDALIDLSQDAYTNLLKIKAYSSWPKAYFFDKSKTRIILNDAEIVNGVLVPTRVTPEGKREMSWTEYIQGRKITP